MTNKRGQSDKPGEKSRPRNAFPTMSRCRPEMAEASRSWPQGRVTPNLHRLWTPARWSTASEMTAGGTSIISKSGAVVKSRRLGTTTFQMVTL